MLYIIKSKEWQKKIPKIQENSNFKKKKSTKNMIWYDTVNF